MKKIILVIMLIYCVKLLDAATINIPADYSTIQEGINAANDGDTVLVQPGTYVENINYNGKNITVGSLFLTTQDTSYISQTIIDGNQNGRVVSAIGGYSSLLGVKIINGGGININGGGIHCYGNSTIKNVVVTNNSVSGDGWEFSYGGGILCGGNSTIKNVVITNNSVDYGYGGGIHCYGNSSPSLENVKITGNDGDCRGGGIYCISSSPSLENVTITNNSAGKGGGIYCHNSSSSPSLDNVTITGNSANEGGGIFCYSSSPSIINSIVSDNTGNYGIYVYSGSPSITYSDVWNNENGNFYGCSPGIGCIEADPLFIDPINGDYHLSWVNYPIKDTTMSPCIDAGDPNSSLDPDSTIADMGAYYYYQEDLIFLPIDITGAPACNIFIPLYYTNIFNIGIEGIEVTISYDNSILCGTGATLTGTVFENEDYEIQYNTVSDSLLNLWIYSTGDLVAGSGIVAYLEFMVEQSANIGDYSELIFEEAEVNEDSVSTSNGLFTVEVDFQISLPIDVGAASGAQINIPINVNNYNNIGMEGIETIIRYDNDILNATGATLTNGILENQNYGIQTSTGADSITIWIYANDDLFTGEGIVAYIEFDVEENVVIGSTSPLEFIFAEINENPVSTEDGLFTIIEAYSISGKTKYYFNELVISNAMVVLESNKNFSITDTTGYYEFINMIPGNYTSSALKEDDLGGLSSLDASRIARYGVGLYSLNDYEIIAADVSMNASVSPLDASRVARYGVGLIDELNDDNIHWVFAADSVDSSSWPPINYETFKYYTPLNANMIDEDFVGVRLGDVTGNWAPAKKKLITGTKDITASLPEVTGAPTDTVTVPLDVFGLENFEGMDITISFNEQVIDALGATLNGGILENENFGFQVNTNNDNEIILWIYALGDPYSGSGTVAFIDFEVVGVVDDSTDIAFTQFDVNEVDYLYNTEDGSLLVVPYSINGNDIPKEIFLDQNYPNPIKNKTEIYFGLTKKSDVEISIYNLKGQLVETVIQGNFDPGYHSINYSLGNLSNGIYFYKMSVDGVDKEIRKMILLRDN